MSPLIRLCKALLYQQAFRALPTTFAADYIRVPWSTKSYGPDGPWQAVKITVGGTSEDILLINENHASVDLLPAGIFNSKILTPAACEPYQDDKTCGAGGMWDPETDASVAAGADWVNEAAGIVSRDQGILLQATTTENPGISYWNTSLAMIENVTITSPNGRERGPELGTFALGGPEQVQRFATDPTHANKPILGFTFGGAAFNKSKTRSFSYGLQIGSADLGYAGSLIIGGYDKGRLIGPYTSYPDGTSLLDINIAVAAGGSPFGFKQKDGLLVSNTSEPSRAMPVLPDPEAPYLHLPNETCAEIAKHIPVRFDSELQYWLWNTDDPNYETIVKSPAYLGFTFPPATGKSQNVTVKVPFQLLNLTLTKPITNTPTAYFPCVDYTPSEDSSRYVLGRAFLQAAFLGRNWNGKVSWLAQAPGPGVSRIGLGEYMLDIEDSDLELPEVFDNQDLFAQSWEPYWTSLPGDDAADPPAPESSDNSTSSPDSPGSNDDGGGGLSVGAKAGIGLGTAAVAILAIGVGVLYMRSRKKQAPVGTTAAPSEYSDVMQKEALSFPNELEQPPQELNGGSHHWTYELPTGTPEIGTQSPPQHYVSPGARD